MATDDGHPRVLAVNVLAPYVLTALMHRPKRLVYLSSMMHTLGSPSLDDIEWTTRPWHAAEAYGDSKLLLVVFANVIGRRWPDVCSSAVDPGWVPTRMGGPGATDDLSLGHVTQCWLAVSDDPLATTTGQYWYHQEIQSPADAVTDWAFQDVMLAEFGDSPASNRPECGDQRDRSAAPLKNAIHAGDRIEHIRVHVVELDDVELTRRRRIEDPGHVDRPSPVGTGQASMPRRTLSESNGSTPGNPSFKCRARTRPLSLLTSAGNVLVRDGSPEDIQLQHDVWIEQRHEVLVTR